VRNSTVSLVGDIGGTNCRLALANNGQLLHESIMTYAVAAFPSLTHAVQTYLNEHNIKIDNACLAIAGPVDGDLVRLTNQAWQFSIEQMRIDLNFKLLRIVNDFEAVGLALPHLNTYQLRQIGGRQAEPQKSKVALGPGTGYGATHVITYGNTVIALPTESGHISIAPSTQREVNVFQWLLDKNLQITCEQLLSGPGLQTLYRALYDLEFKGTRQFENLSAAEIQARAVENVDSLCIATLNLFCELLGTAARDQALCCLAKGGIYIAGGIVQRFIPFLRASGFRQRFESSATMRAILEPLPIYVITEENPGLIGAARSTFNS
jgi:glucokinase